MTVSISNVCPVIAGPAVSAFCDASTVPVDDSEIVSRITAICDEFEKPGYRRVSKRSGVRKAKPCQIMSSKHEPVTVIRPVGSTEGLDSDA